MQWTRQRVAILLSSLFLASLAALVARGLFKAGVFEEGKYNDFHAYHAAAQGVWKRDLVPSYEDPLRANLYPPTFSCLVAPLGLLSYRWAAVTWVLLNGALVFYIFQGLDRILGIPLSAAAKVAGFLLVFRLVESDFANGNANVFVLAIVLGAIDLLWKRGEALSGGLFSLAILSKVSPAIFLAWAAYRLRWRFLAGVAGGLLFFGFLLPTVVLGPKGAARAWDAWRNVTLTHMDPGSESYSREVASGYEPGQSLRALVHRLLRDSDATSHDGEVVSIHLLQLSKMTADEVYFFLAAVILGLGLLGNWMRAPGLRIAFRPEEIAAACAAMVLLAPISRKAHFVALWPAAVLGFEAWRLCEHARLSRMGSGLWALALICVVATSPDIVGRTLSTRLQAYCPMSWAAAALLILSCAPGFFPRGNRKLSDVTTEAPGCPIAGNPLCNPAATDPEGSREG